MNDKNIRIYKEVVEIVTQAGKISPVEISFGYVNKDGFCVDGLIIKQCPHVIIQSLISHGFILTMTDRGILVDDL